MGKQNGKKVSQKQRSQKKSSSLKKYKKKGGSSQKGGFAYKYDVLIGKEDGGITTGTRERFISDIFNMIKDNEKFETFFNDVINPYTKQKVCNTQYSDVDGIQNIIVPYFFTLPGTTFEGQEEAETDIAEGAGNQGKKLGIFSRMFGPKTKSGGTLKETPTIPENTKKGLGIADNVKISAFQYAILKGNYDLVNGIFKSLNENNGGSLLKKYVKEPLAKFNGTDIELTQPYYLPFTQGYYTEDQRLIIGTSNRTVDATTMQQFVDLFKKHAPDYTIINSQMGGEDVTVEDIKKIIYLPKYRRSYQSKIIRFKTDFKKGIITQNQKEIIKKNIFPDNNNVNFENLTDEQMDPIIDAIIRILINNAKKVSKQNTDEIKALVVKNLLETTPKELIDLITVQEGAVVTYEGQPNEFVPTSSSNTTLTQSSSDPSQETSQALVLPASNNYSCIYEEAPQCDSNKSKEENEELLSQYETAPSSYYFNPVNNKGCNRALKGNAQLIHDNITGKPLSEAHDNCKKVVDLQKAEEEAESGSEEEAE